MRTFSLGLSVAFGLGFAVWAGTVAQAQTTGAPGGTAPATAPGGTMGRAGPRNIRSAVRSGEAYSVGRRGRIRKVRPVR